MYQVLFSLIGLIAIFSLDQTFAIDPTEHQEVILPKVAPTSYNVFTGRITKNKVRMRLGSALDAPIVRELNKGELVIVIGENDEFYTIQPPSDIKGYIFRTFVLDNKIEGNRVNVRLAPNTEAPIIAQLNSGDQVEGVISPANNKWLEIYPPSHVYFYIAKDYVEKAGDRYLIAQIAKKRNEVNHLLQSTYLISQQELQKPFPDINLDRIIANYKKIIQDYTDFPDQVARSQELLEELHENYLHKKIAHLEALAETRQYGASPSRSSLSLTAVEPFNFPAVPSLFEDVEEHQSTWNALENALYEEWSKVNKGTVNEFYAAEKKRAVQLTGILQPYNRTSKNKPGDYVLLNPATQVPLAFLYSTQIQLKDYIGKEVAVTAVPRPNNDYAYPAYFVLSIR